MRRKDLAAETWGKYWSWDAFGGERGGSLGDACPGRGVLAGRAKLLRTLRVRSLVLNPAGRTRRTAGGGPPYAGDHGRGPTLEVRRPPPPARPSLTCTRGGNEGDSPEKRRSRPRLRSQPASAWRSCQLYGCSARDPRGATRSPPPPNYKSEIRSRGSHHSVSLALKLWDGVNAPSSASQ